MDRKSIIILILSIGLLMAWGPLVNKLFPPIPLSPEELAASSNRVAQVESTNAVSATPTDAPPSFNAVATTNAAAALIPANSPEQQVVWETGEAKYIFTSHGGGLKEVELKKYPQAVSCGKKVSSTGFASLNERAHTPIFSMPGNVQGDGVFKITKTATGVRAEKTLPSGLHIIKDFTPTSNYLVQAKITVQNLGDGTNIWPASEIIIGTGNAISENEEALYIGALWHDGADLHPVTGSWFDNHKFGCAMFGSNPRSLYEGGSSNVTWAAVHNQFFTTALMPPTNAPASRVHVRRIQMSKGPGGGAVEEKKQYLLQGFEAGLAYPPIVIEPQHQHVKEFTLYAGPKEYNLLAKHAIQFNNDIDEVMNFGKYIGVFSKVLLLLMNQLHSFGLTYGLAIVAMTIIIKLLFWPLTTASTRSMKRMAALQPQMQAINEKYKDDPAKKNEKIMEFMRANKVNPIGGCLPLLLQMPVFFGLIGMLRTSIELRGAKFLWACDLSQPDTVYVLFDVFPINPMWFLMLGTMVWQMKMTPMSPGMDPTQQKIMKWMPVAFMAFFYNFSAGLTLYWAIQNLLSVLQTKLTRTNDPVPAGPAAPTKPAAPTAPRKKK